MIGVLTAAAGAHLHAQAGPAGREIDRDAADRGRALYARYCINCHGSGARGTEQGPDLIRSVVVLHDDRGSGIGPALQKGAGHTAKLSDAQVADLAEFLRQQVEATAKDRTATRPPNVLTGNAEAGKTYFNGAGRCSGCHSPTGDLAGIASKYDPVTLQQRFLFPRLPKDSKGVEVTVTPPGGPPVTGELVRIDDFNVSLRDASGQYRAWKRVPGMIVEIHDPLAAHHQMLNRYTDADIHNIVAYLETLK